MNIEIKTFKELDTSTLYDILQLRSPRICSRAKLRISRHRRQRQRGAAHNL